jgi:glycosyltransferase involved in cell wall biosynthesis
MSGSQLPRASLCLLTYKRAQVLPRTLDSLLRQSHDDFELIINDDCSPDDTQAVCTEYARRDPRIRYCRNARNLRYAGNQNAALCRATTDYVAIVHDGDVYRSDLLERWTKALVDNPSAAVAFSAAERLDEEGRVTMVYRHPYAPLVPGRQLLDEMFHSLASPIFGIVMVRRSHVRALNPFDPRLPVLADVDMWMRLLAKHDAAYVAEPLYGVSPREAGHQNTYTNWRVREEHELIYALNHRRRFVHDPSGPEATRNRRAMASMLWRARAQQLFACLRHGEARGLLRGLGYLRSRPSPLATDDVADCVLTWEDFERAESASLKGP